VCWAGVWSTALAIFPLDKVIKLYWWKGEPSGSIFCTRKQQPRFYWSCSSVVMNDATLLTPPSAWAELHFQMQMHGQTTLQNGVTLLLCQLPRKWLSFRPLFNQMDSDLRIARGWMAPMPNRKAYGWHRRKSGDLSGIDRCGTRWWNIG